MIQGSIHNKYVYSVNIVPLTCSCSWVSRSVAICRPYKIVYTVYIYRFSYKSKTKKTVSIDKYYIRQYLPTRYVLYKCTRILIQVMYILGVTISTKILKSTSVPKKQYRQIMVVIKLTKVYLVYTKDVTFYNHEWHCFNKILGNEKQTIWIIH